MTNASLSNLKEIADLWNKVEGRAKATEQFRSALDAACINEMRYAGRRMADVILALESGASITDQRVLEDIVMAKNYLYNADHDLTDATIYFAHKRFARAIEFHGYKKVVALFPDYQAFSVEIEAAHAIVQGSRIDRPKRKADYEKLAADYVPKLRDMYERFSKIDALQVPDSVPEKIGILDKNVTLLAWFNVIVGAIGVVSIVIAIWAALVGLHTDQQVDRLVKFHDEAPGTAAAAKS